MTKRLSFGLAAAIGLSACSARASGKIEKPPSVPPEVDQARVICPALDGPCFGYYTTRWRVLPPCDLPPVVLPGPLRPSDVAPMPIPRAKDGKKPEAGTKQPTSAPQASLPATVEAPSAPIPIRPIQSSGIRPVKNESMPSISPGKANALDPPGL